MDLSEKEIIEKVVGKDRKLAMSIKNDTSTEEGRKRLAKELTQNVRNMIKAMKKDNFKILSKVEEYLKDLEVGIFFTLTLAVKDKIELDLLEPEDILNRFDLIDL